MNTKTTNAIRRIEHLQQELEELKRILSEDGQERGRVERKPLEGLWEGVRFSEEDIEEAKRSWLKDIDG